MDQTTRILNQVLPILLLIGLGALLRSAKTISDSAAEDLKKIIVNTALPSVLFLAFLRMELKTEYLALFFGFFTLCVLLLLLGKALRPALGRGHEYFPFMATGFEYGMLGVSLIGSAYGIEAIGYSAIIALGHEIFIWFVFVPLLLSKRDGITRPRELMRVFFTAPVILGILSGIALNLLGLSETLETLPATGAVLKTLAFLSNLTVPLILIVVGHTLRLHGGMLKEALPLVSLRFILLIPLALAINTYVLRGLLHLARPFEVAFFTIVILPAPFIIPLFMKNSAEMEAEKTWVTNTLTINTIISIAVFAVYLSLL